MPVTKKGAKVLMKDHADLKKNKPKIDKDGDLFIVKIYSNVNKGYISVAEYTNMKTARADLKHFQKDHKETLDKILRLSKDVIKESVIEEFNGIPKDSAGKGTEITSLDEGLNLPADVAKKLKASVASKAKGKIIPFHSRMGSDSSTFGYTDAKGKKNTVVKLDREVSKQEADKILKAIRQKYSVNEGFGAYSQKKNQDASKAMWDKLTKQHKDNKALIKKATQYYSKNMKPEFAFKKAMEDLKESIDVVAIYGGKSSINEAGKIKGETVFIDYDNGFYMITGSKSLYVYEYLESMKDAQAYAKKNKLKIR